MDWLAPDVQLLLGTAASIGIVHTIIGPDHYLPFIAVARERGWSFRRTLAITACCGIGHCTGSVLLGFIGIALGLGLGSLESFEASRGTMTAWLLLGFGLAYVLWSIRRWRRSRTHTHRHVHADGTVHTHEHGADHDHLHVHADSKARPLFVALLIVFLLGPCEALIPMLMYPAAESNVPAVVAVALVFSFFTVATMLGAVAAGLHGTGRLRVRIPHGISGVLTGTIVSACGLAMLVGF